MDKTAHQLIDSLPISPLDSFILLKELLDSVGVRGNRVRRAQRCIRMGAEQLGRGGHSITFERAAGESLSARSHRRTRTLQEIRSVLKRMLRHCPTLAKTCVEDISTEQCRKWLDRSFSTPRQWLKGRMILSGILAYAVKRGWCRENPASRLPCPALQEKRIYPLSLYECRQLLRTAARLHKGACLPACALMLYAGLRPQETLRLSWHMVNLKERIINIAPQHSKTGGCRQVMMQPALVDLLKRYRPAHASGQTICPSNWAKKWREVRYQSGIFGKSGWVQDVLRHTFASYHYSFFRDKLQLMYEMGHQNSHLLDRRYLNLERITPTTSERFWSESFVQNATNISA